MSTERRTPDITPLRDASVGFGLWPWSNGPLWRLEVPWPFVVVTGSTSLEFVIPAGYEFDKASVPSFLWGFPFNYTPDGLCTVPALEHDFLCDLFHGGSPWLKERLGTVPAGPSAAVIHRHFYDRLLAWGVRPSKARMMWEGVRDFGPGGRMWPLNWFKKRTGVSALLSMACLLLCACGTTRAQRFQIYGLVLDATGHPEFRVPVRVIGEVLKTQNPGGK